MSSLNGAQETNHTNGLSNGSKADKRLNEITDDMPAWKQALLKKKNEEIIAGVAKEKAIEEAEKKKYADLPGWKAEILKRKEEDKLKQEQLEKEKEMQRQAEENYLKTKPVWQQELIKRRNSYQKSE